jgi:hypothetical protein
MKYEINVIGKENPNTNDFLNMACETTEEYEFLRKIIDLAKQEMMDAVMKGMTNVAHTTDTQINLRA